jgi:hypothetical protein
MDTYYDKLEQNLSESSINEDVAVYLMILSAAQTNTVK